MPVSLEYISLPEVKHDQLITVALAQPATTDTAVTRLLVATRQLLEALTSWAKGDVTDEQVSDVYVKLGNDFNTAVTAFSDSGIPMDDLLSIPNDLRVSLEAALALDPSQENLDIYMPQIRDIIVVLLQGLKNKQTMQRRRKQERDVSGTGSTVPSRSAYPQPQQGLSQHGPSSSTHRDVSHQSQFIPQATTESRGPVSQAAARTSNLPFNPTDFGGQQQRGSAYSTSSQRSYQSGSNVNGYSVERSYNTLDARAMSRTDGSRSSSSQPRQAATLSGRSTPASYLQDPSISRPSREHRPLPHPQGSSVSQSSVLSSSSGPRSADNPPARPLPRAAPSGPLPPAPPDAFKPSRSRVDGRISPAPNPTSQASQPSNSHQNSAGSQLWNLQVQPQTQTLERHKLVDKPVSPAAPEQADGRPPSFQVPMTPPPRRQNSHHGSNAVQLGESSNISGAVRTPQQPASRFSLDSELDSPAASRVRDSKRQTVDTQPTIHETLASPSESSNMSHRPSGSLTGLGLTGTDGHLDPQSEREIEAKVNESPAVMASLSALQKSEGLGRRASKRYSQYQYKQMIPSHTKMPSNASMLGHTRQSSNLGQYVVTSPSRPQRAAERDIIPPLPPLPPLSHTPARSPEVSASSSQGEDSVSNVLPAAGTGEGAVNVRPDPPSPSGSMIIHEPETTAIKIFLQYGRETKKTEIEPRDISTIADVQGLFMNKFDYAPEGMELFPEVYIKDPATGVAYQLEELEDIKPGILLSLNIDPLDQVRQHFDNTISALSHEIKDLKTNIANNRRMSLLHKDSSPMQPSVDRLSPSMHAADRFPSRNSPVKVLVPTVPAIPPAEPLPPSATGPGAFQSNVDLTSHYDEIQHLRRDLGILRQVYVDFVASTKETFTTLRQQTQSVREVAMSKLSGSRALVDTAKKQLESDSSDTVQAVEEVSDAIDAVKHDVLKRQIMPRPGELKKIKDELVTAKSLVDKLKEQVSLAGPSWKQTWNQELKNVVEEQHLLQHQEKLAADLEGDIIEVTEVFDTLQQYVAQRQQGMMAARRQAPIPRRESIEGTDGGGQSLPHLLMEIRTKDADPDRRLKAIEQQQKVRERELAAKTDDFADELSGFVSGKKLKKTGGTEEAERIRIKKQETALKKMYEDKSQAQSGSATPVSVAGLADSMPNLATKSPSKGEEPVPTDQNDVVEAAPVEAEANDG